MFVSAVETVQMRDVEDGVGVVARELEEMETCGSFTSDTRTFSQSTHSNPGIVR